MEIEIGIAKSGRRAWGFDDIAIVPSRRHDIARFGLRAVIGGTLVNLLNASLAGFFFSLRTRSSLA